MSDNGTSEVKAIALRGRRAIYPEGTVKKTVPLTLAENELKYLTTYVASSGAAAARKIVRDYLAAETLALEVGTVSDLDDQALLGLLAAVLRLEGRLQRTGGDENALRAAVARRKQIEAELVRRLLPPVSAGGLAVNN